MDDKINLIDIRNSSKLEVDSIIKILKSNRFSRPEERYDNHDYLIYYTLYKKTQFINEKNLNTTTYNTYKHTWFYNPKWGHGPYKINKTYNILEYKKMMFKNLIKSKKSN